MFACPQFAQEPSVARIPESDSIVHRRRREGVPVPVEGKGRIFAIGPHFSHGEGVSPTLAIPAPNVHLALGGERIVRSLQGRDGQQRPVRASGKLGGGLDGQRRDLRFLRRVVDVYTLAV